MLPQLLGLGIGTGYIAERINEWAQSEGIRGKLTADEIYEQNKDRIFIDPDTKERYKIDRGGNSVYFERTNRLPVRRKSVGGPTPYKAEKVAEKPKYIPKDDFEVTRRPTYADAINKQNNRNDARDRLAQQQEEARSRNQGINNRFLDERAKAQEWQRDMERLRQRGQSQMPELPKLPSTIKNIPRYGRSYQRYIVGRGGKLRKPFVYHNSKYGKYDYYSRSGNRYYRYKKTPYNKYSHKYKKNKYYDYK